MIIEVEIFLLLFLLGMLACFGVAAVAEFWSSRKGVGLLLRMIQIVVGMIAVFALPFGFLGNTGLSRAWLSWTMVCVLLLVGVLSLFSKYASSTALIFVLLGNGILAFCWYYNGAYHNVTDDRTDRIHWADEWHTEVISSPPTYGQNGAVYLLRPNDRTSPKGFSLVSLGAQWQWEIRPSGGICTLPAVADDGTVFFGTGTNDDSSHGLYVGQGSVWAVSPEGRRKWTYEFPPATFFRTRDFGGGAVFPPKSPACSQPAVAADGTTYWLGHGVYALTSDGALRWAFDPGEDFYALAIAEDGSVYALADGTLFTLAPDRTQRWKYSFEESKYSAGELAVGTDGTVFFTNRYSGGLSSQLFALTPQGMLKWRIESYDLMGGPLIASDGTVYITVSIHVEGDGNQKQVVAFDPNGEAKWNTPNGSSLLNLASDGTLYICYVRDLFAISPRGRMLWKANLPNDPSIHIPTNAVTLAPNAKFYIGDFLGRLGTLDVPAALATSGWPAPFHDARNTARAGAH
ncbi:MAG TPA: PQQ-binding-like beta-propeller repeat protein [Candidatus Sulfotelmatobacter sp.]|nr:PQQ-binding-like beta-propeller repeat protein [Candidatus Sulfotelmatobacter sp.]